MAAFRPETWNGEPIPYHESIAVLRSLIRTSGNKAWAAISALGERPEPEATAVLVDLTRSPDPHLRRSAVEAIGKHCSARNAVDVVLKMLDDRDSFVVQAASRAAAALRLAAAHDRIQGLIEAKDEDTRYTALEALERLWEPSDFDAVFARYRNDPSDKVRKRAACTLAENVGAEHWEPVFQAWSRDSIPRHRTWACSIAERFGNRGALPILSALVSDPDGHVRRAAERASKEIYKS